MKNRRRKRKLKKSVKITLVSLLVIGLLSYPTYKLLTKEKTPTNKTKPSIEEKEKHYELSLIAVGDNLIHGSVYKDANKHANYNGYDFKPMITNIKEIVSNYDIGYYNQETILGGTELGLKDFPTFNSPYEAGDAMIDAGFNLVSLATNHTMDSGKKAVENSCKYWSSKENVLTAGSYCSEEERNEIKIKEKNNITYTMLNYTYGTNGMKVPNDYLVNVWPTDIDNINNPEKDTKYQEYKNQVKQDIEKVRDKVDVLIVAMHWGVEYKTEPSKYQVKIAEALNEYGVDLILGSNPHVVQPIEEIEGENGNKTLVAYSLGNFISNQRLETMGDRRTADGIILNLTLDKSRKGVKIEKWDYTPTWVYKIPRENKTSDYYILPVEETLNSEEGKKLDQETLNQLNKSLESTKSIVEK